MTKILKYGSISLAFSATFLSGVFAGNFYNEFDILCNSVSPHVLTKKMVSESGITFPKGTVIPVKHCAYRKRFDWEFAMDISVELEVAEDVSADEYGFSLLEVDE